MKLRIDFGEHEFIEVEREADAIFVDVGEMGARLSSSSGEYCSATLTLAQALEVGAALMVWASDSATERENALEDAVRKEK